MARSRINAEDEDNEDGKVKREPKKAKKKRVSPENINMKVGDISNVPGKVQIAAGDIITHDYYEEATAAKTEKEFEVKELKELRASVFEKFESLKIQRAAQLETGRIFHRNALELNEGKYLLGRAEYLAELRRKVKSEQIVFLSGRGGVGRTSLLQAGLMPDLLEQGHLPVLVTVSREPLALSIKRNILTGVDSTTYLKRLNLAKFLEQATKFLPENKRLVLLIDDFEKIYETRVDNEREEFETEWGYTRNNPRLGWLFSIDRGFTARLVSFQPEEILEVPPLDHAAARQALLVLEQDGRTLEDPYLDEIVNELGSHRDALQGASINPSELQVVLRALAESNARQPLSKVYEEKERLSGIFEDHLVSVINNTFIPTQRPVVWQLLTFLKEEYGTPVSTAWIESKLSAYGFETKEVPQLLGRLRKQHVIRAKEESYELAHVNLMRGIQKWLKEQTLLKNARDESIEQLENIRASALRGLLGGALGFGLFRWIVGGPIGELILPAIVFFTLLSAVIGAMSGLPLTFFIDVFIMRYRGSHPWHRYLLSAVTGLVTFGLGLGLYAYLFEIAENERLQFLFSMIVGGAWGAVTGAGIAWALSSPQLQKWKIPLIAMASALTLYVFNRFLPVLTSNSNALAILAGGFWVPFVILVSILFWKRFDPE
jgi:hypothetical protein